MSDASPAHPRTLPSINVVQESLEIFPVEAAAAERAVPTFAIYMARRIFRKAHEKA